MASFEVGEYPDDPLYREQVREAAHALFSLLSDDERAVCAVFGDECEECRSRLVGEVCPNRGCVEGPESRGEGTT